MLASTVESPLDDVGCIGVGRFLAVMFCANYLSGTPDAANSRILKIAGLGGTTFDNSI